jgi:hypothetical protein
MQIAPAAVKTAIRQHEFEKNARPKELPGDWFLPPKGRSLPFSREVPYLLTRITFEFQFQLLIFSVADEIRVHQRKTSGSRDLAST